MSVIVIFAGSIACTGESDQPRTDIVQSDALRLATEDLWLQCDDGADVVLGFHDSTTAVYLVKAACSASDNRFPGMEPTDGPGLYTFRLRYQRTNGDGWTVSEFRDATIWRQPAGSNQPSPAEGG